MNLSKIKTETLLKRYDNMYWKVNSYYKEHILQYQNKTNDDLTNVDRFILTVAVQEGEINNFDIKELVAKWKQEYNEMCDLMIIYKNEILKRGKKIFY